MIKPTDPAATFALQPVPVPPMQVWRLMLATTALIDGFVDQAPIDFHPALENSMIMPQAGIMLTGTRCGTPLLVREVRNIARAVDRDAIIVRAAPDPTLATFDVMLSGVQRPFLGYRVWIRQPMGCAWFVPTAGEASFIRLDPEGLEVSRSAPYVDEVDRHRGLEAGREFLSVAVAGWF